MSGGSYSQECTKYFPWSFCTQTEVSHDHSEEMKAVGITRKIAEEHPIAVGRGFKV